MALGPAEVAHGPMLIGTFLALILFGISVTQVFVVFVADTTHTIFIMAYMYLSLVKHFGDIPYISDSTWGIIGGLVQSFYGWRVQILLGNWFVTLIIFVGALANMLMGIATAIGADIVKAFSEFQRFQVVVIIWAVTAMAADLIIMATLVLHLVNYHSSFHGKHLFFNFTLAKLYTNSLLSSLNSRGGWKFMDSTSDHNPITTSRSGIYTEHGVSQHVFIQVESHEMMDQNQKGAAIDSEY
ncbi:hypothetical protein EV359DRAFT_73063 [Lentinula novae-zelandiae]|nr:hypothetical protein EV359DRAFT_73063 [Lentinula novae-zelandiae]